MIDHHGLCLGSPCSCDTVATGPIELVPGIKLPEEATVRIPLHQITVLPNIPAGMNPYVVMSLTYLYRSTSDDTVPIKVIRDGELYKIVDGRHRFVASLMAGRPDVLAMEV